MTDKRVDPPTGASNPPVVDPESLPEDVGALLKYNQPNDEDMTAVAQLRASSEPWKSRGEKYEESVEAVTKLRPFVQMAKIQTQPVGYVTIERDGPVPGAAYMRNIVVKTEFRQKGIGTKLLQHALQTARDMHRKTLALRVDPANSVAVSFYRSHGFTTVATVVSKKSGKLRLLMSREL